MSGKDELEKDRVWRERGLSHVRLAHVAAGLQVLGIKLADVWVLATKQIVEECAFCLGCKN